MSNNVEQYSADNIKVLTDIQHIRLRKGMYVGDAIDPRQSIVEAIDNAVDEVQAGYSSELVVLVDTENNSYSVRDYGRGIPHGKKKLDTGEEKEILEVLLTKSNSGGKYDNKSYNHAAGLHGLGLTIINALSEKVHAETHRDGRVVSIDTDHGEVVNLSYDKSNEPNGTFISFIPDETIYKSKVIPIELIKNRCKITSAMGYKARLIIDGVEQEDVNATMFDLISEEDSSISVYQQFNIIRVETDNDEMKVAIRYTSDTTERYFGYTNMLYNSIGGTHVQELSKAIIAAWKEFLEKNKKMKPETELRNSDYLLGIRAVCAVFIMKPEYSSQTKERLTVDKKYLAGLMNKFKSEFMNLLSSDIKMATALLKRFEEYRISQNKLLARKEISSIIKINNDDPNNIRRRSISDKLKDCTSRNREGTEILVCEGDSAASPIVRVRDKTTQAVLSLRGRILNVTNMQPKDAIKSQEICNLANSFGCGLGSVCDASKSRYSRAVYISDPDPDGYAITNLVLSVFVNMLPDIVRSGMLYLAKIPLYIYYDKSGVIHGCDNISDIPIGMKYARIKGLGELDDPEVAALITNRESRQLYQVSYPSDLKEFNYVMGTSIGKSSLLKDLGVLIDVR